MTISVAVLVAFSIPFLQLSAGKSYSTNYLQKRFKDDVSGVEYQYLGCFKDKYAERTLIPFANIRSEINWKKWPDLSPTINKCAGFARMKGYTIFAVQNWGECWGDKSGSKMYARHGKSNRCYSGVGSGFKNAVYRISKRNCEVNGQTIRENQTYYDPPTPPFNQASLWCRKCQCKGGRGNCSKKITCEVFFKCEKFAPVKKGECCPVCECYHNGNRYSNGQEWAVHVSAGNCMQCSCINSRASCVHARCHQNCPNPVPIPGKCCPNCELSQPVVPTMILVPGMNRRPPLVIPTRPPLAIPPRPRYPGKEKRSSKRTNTKQQPRGSYN